MLSKNQNKPPSDAGGFCGTVMLAGIVLLALFGVFISGNEDILFQKMEDNHEVEMAKLPDTLEERQVDALENVAQAGYASNVAIASSGFTAVSAVAWSHTATWGFIALIVVGLAVIVVVVSRKNSGGGQSNGEAQGIPVDIPTYTRQKRD